jgi:hypothetical protein
MQSTPLTVHHLIQLPQMHFLTHTSQLTVDGYIQILLCERSRQRKNFQNIPSERGSNMSHKTPAAAKLRMFFSCHSLNSAF